MLAAARWPRVVALVLALASLTACTTLRAGAAERPKSRACTEPIPDIFDRTSPAVVFIAATSINPHKATDRVSHVVGSGFIVDPAGLVLTNAHVVFRRQSIRVTLDDGAIVPAELVGADPIFDIAVVRIAAPAQRTLPALAAGDSDAVRVGDEVLVIGNPLGLDQTLTRGIVSAVNRILADTPFSVLEPLIQTDAPINPGNSGGPLLDRCGEVIGITTAMVSDANNIGFAIPINLVKGALPSLVSRGHLVRPWLGFHGQLVGDTLRDLLRTPLVEGLLIEVIEPGSPAEQAGLQGGSLEVVIAGREFLVGGDIVTSLNGTRLGAPERVTEAMRALKVGDTVTLTIFRDGEYRQVEYVLPERPLLPGDVTRSGSMRPLRGRRR